MAIDEKKAMRAINGYFRTRGCTVVEEDYHGFMVVFDPIDDSAAYGRSLAFVKVMLREGPMDIEATVPPRSEYETAMFDFFSEDKYSKYLDDTDIQCNLLEMSVRKDRALVRYVKQYQLEE